MNSEINSVVDAAVRVNVAPAGLSASIYISSPVGGGKDINLELINKTLFKNKVVYGIDNNLLNQIVSEKKYNTWFLVAKAKPSVNGVNGAIHYFFDKTVNIAPVADDKGFVDYKNLGTIRNIDKGTVIAKITPEVKGKAGTSVFNTPISFIEGKPAPVTFGQNIILSADKSELIADTDGNLVFIDGRFEVQTTVRIYRNLDVAIGNIEFSGDVEIHGDIAEGFSVMAGGKITVTGTVYSAKLTAGSTIMINSGVLYSDIISKRDVITGFAESSSINCQSLLKAKSLYNCNVYCDGNIVITGGNGSIIGGKTVASGDITAWFIGNKGYAATQIVVGNNAIMQQEKNSLDEQIDTLTNQVEQCNMIIEFLNKKKEQLGYLPQDKVNLLAVSQNTIEACTLSISQMKNKQQLIDDNLSKKQTAGITVSKEIFPGVKITINNIVMTTQSVYQHCRVIVGDDGIKFIPI